MQIVIEVLASQRRYGTVSQLAQRYAVSRQTVYQMAAKGQQVLSQGLEPGRHGPSVGGADLVVDRNRLVRGSVMLSAVGVSQRNIVMCLEELLDSRLSSSWVNAVLAEVEAAAGQVNESWQPKVEETLAGDEIYANGQPNLLVVGNDSLYIYALSRQPDCDGDTWGCTLLAGPVCQQFASDAGKGLAAGAKAAEIEVHQLDWDHLLRPLWGQAARLEQQAYAVLEQVEQRAAQFEHSRTEKRLQQHLAKWDQLRQVAADKVAVYDAFASLARQVDAWFALIELDSGQLRDVTAGINQLQALGQQLQAWSGRIYQKLSRNLQNWAAGLFSYQPLLAQALQPLQATYGPQAIAALCRLWQIEADLKRRPRAWLEQQRYQTAWANSLTEASTLLGEQLWPVWEQVAHLLDRSWRGSSLAECVNSLLRPYLAGRKQTDQGCLDLFRFLHNTHSFQRGKRAGSCPAQLVGLEVPNDPLILLGLKPKVSI
jgi:hypothetical protein